MSTLTYDPTGALLEQWDDTTRTYTDFTTTPATTRPYTATENAQADADAFASATMTDQQWQEALRDDYIARHTITDPGSTDVPAWSDTGVYSPGAAVTYDGHTWVNQSGAWLNGSYIPGDVEHPFWSQQADGETPTPWATGMHLTPSLLVSNGGQLYRWAGADTATAPANYAPTGTVNTAAWTYIGPVA